MHLMPYVFKNWFIDAYNTFAIAITLGKKGKNPLSETEKNECAQFVWDELQKLTADNLDAKWQEIIKKLVAKYPKSLRVGTAQFLISLPCKFAYLLWVIYPDELKEPWRKLLEAIGSKCPVPINRNVIYNLRKRYFKEFPDLRCRGLERHVLSEGAWVPWTQLENYATYWSLQKRIRALADQEQITPMEFEARYLWNQVGGDEIDETSATAT